MHLEGTVQFGYRPGWNSLKSRSSFCVSLKYENAFAALALRSASSISFTSPPAAATFSFLPDLGRARARGREAARDASADRRGNVSRARFAEVRL